jgi:heme/copper-type cytochrome/quinol oxidase subunit 2
MIEWQNESSLFTIRIQGKQWYWVYKYDPNTAQAVMSTPKNIGHNRWRVTSGQESYNADTYYQAIHLAAHLEFQDSYTKFTKKIDTHRKNLLSLSIANEKTLITNDWSIRSLNTTYNSEFIKDCEGILELNTGSLSNLNYQFDPRNTNYGDSYDFFTNSVVSNQKNYTTLQTRTNNTIFNLYRLDNTLFSEVFFEDLIKTNNFNSYYDFLQLDETSDADSNTRHFLTTQPFRLMKGVINQHVVDVLQSYASTDKLNKLLLFNTKFSTSGEGLKEKELMPETLWGFRQKKYKRMKKFKFKPEVIYDPVTFKVVGSKQLPSSPKIDIAVLSTQPLNTAHSNMQEENQFTFNTKSKTVEDTFNYRIASQINRHRSELVPVTLARRLLRTKRTLVLPAHVNLTLITNSYDVVHSWFVPGLGLKIDCVPGRSTHHTFYIDNIGFYYGQCAEICGRYHHHMPIRLCALPFEHFVVWWQSKGLARMNRTAEINNNKYMGHSFVSPVTREKLIYRMN